MSTKSFIKSNIVQFLLYLPLGKKQCYRGKVTWLQHAFPITFFSSFLSLWKTNGMLKGLETEVEESIKVLSTVEAKTFECIIES